MPRPPSKPQAWHCGHFCTLLAQLSSLRTRSRRLCHSRLRGGPGHGGSGPGAQVSPPLGAVLGCHLGYSKYGPRAALFLQDQGSWMETKEQRVENRPPQAGQARLSPVRLVWGPRPAVGEGEGHVTAGRGGDRPTHEQPPLHPFIPVRHGCGTALCHLQGSVRSLCKRCKEHRSQTEHARL